MNDTLGVERGADPARAGDDCPSTGQASETKPRRPRNLSSEQRFLEQMRTFLPKLRVIAQMLRGEAGEAEDLLQESLLRAWKARASFPEAGDSREWFLHHLRAAMSDPRVNSPRTVELDYAQVVRVPALDDPNLVVRCNETLRALAQLPPHIRQPLELMANGASYVEAAGICRCCLGTFKSRLTRARDTLAGLMNGLGREGESVVW
jgi:RNA polymerase sigma-70 factor (ECF subfamily)